MTQHDAPIISFAPTASSDLDELVGIRIAAMRESLERVGRFDPVRARERLQSGFSPADTRFVLHETRRVGFVVLKTKADHLLLDHLYILPEHQGKGIGGAVLATIFDHADSAGLALRVGALKGSDANRFYQRHGFVQVAEEQWDICYQRPPRQ
ncbi:GNAT family N-acetyltransferase [Herbaspirillum rhizosphaerae]|uniref:GNAT family N-acetyltransferase n=1 Tax=Herbaspirillum rhizosphaerae TaxID=346179 RepID=UPI00067DEDFA|nr:GNAT family N-acetyltransferase [Herbaspirillum rhizosphaerae]